jgi:hypothetical protein
MLGERKGPRDFFGKNDNHEQRKYQDAADFGAHQLHLADLYDKITQVAFNADSIHYSIAISDAIEEGQQTNKNFIGELPTKLSHHLSGDGRGGPVSLGH